MAYQPSVQGRAARRQGYGLRDEEPTNRPGPPDRAPDAPQTFAERQAAGQYRPAPPGSPYNPNQPVDAPPGTFGGQGASPPPPSNPPPGGGSPYGPQNVSDYLYGNVFGYQPFNPGTYSPQNINPGAYNNNEYEGGPGNFSTSTNNIFGYGNTPGSAQMSFTGPNAGRVGGAQEESVYNALRNPSAYNSDVALDTFRRLRGGIDESFNTEKSKIGEEMARRGLDSSTIHGGRLGDALIQHDRTLSDLASNIAEKQASTYGSDRASALAAALGYQGENFNEALGGFNANLAGQGQAAGINLAGHQEARATQGQNFGQDIQRQGFTNDARSRNLQQVLAALGFNQGQQAQQFGQELQTNQTNQGNQQQNIANLLGYGQQQFSNQMATNQFNQQQQNDQFQQWLQAMGMVG